MCATIYSVSKYKATRTTQKQVDYYKIAEAVPAMIAIYNINTGEYLYVNNTIKKILGYTPADFIKGGFSFVSSLMHPEDVPDILAENTHALLRANNKRHAPDDDPIVHFEYRMKHKDGRWIWLRTDGSVFSRSKDGEVMTVLNISLDITRRKEAEILTETAFQTIFKQSPISTQIFSSDGMTIMVNKAWEKLWQTKAGEIVQRYNILQDTQLVEKKRMPFIEKAFKGEVVSIPAMRYELNSKVLGVTEISYKWIKGVIYPIKDKQGKIVQIVLQHEDVTKQMEWDQVLSENERKYRYLIEKGADVIGLINKKHRLDYISPSILQVLGYTPDEMKNMKNPFKLIHPSEFAKIMKMYITLLKNPGGEVKQTLRIRHKNGLYIWIDSIGTNYLHDKTINAVIVNFRDITFRKIREEREILLGDISKTLGSSIDYKTTIQNIKKFIIPHIADYIRIVLVDENKQIKDITAFHSDTKKLSLVDKLYNNYKDETDNDYGVRHILLSGKPEIMPHVSLEEVTKRSGPEKLKRTITALGLTSYMGVPLTIQNKTIGVIIFSSTRKERIYTNEDLLFAQEIARRISNAIENARLYADAQHALQIRDEFISVASHELKTPITSLKLYLQVMQKQLEEKGEEKLAVPLVKVNEQISKLTKLINDLLNVSKIEHGKLEFVMNETDLNDLVQETVEVVQASTRKNKIIIKGKITEKITADGYRIYQVLTNLLTNAIKYSPQATKIIVSLKQQKGQVCISVRDFGIGIDKKSQKHLFEQFYRVTNPQEKTYPGLGMGLYIASEIIKYHGGSMTVKSRKNGGSIFSFSLPLKEDNSTQFK